MKIYSLETGNFKLDGGAMFGVVPKVIWQRTTVADERNLVNLAMRCMLIEDGNRLILIDTGLGNKQSDKFFGYYYLNGNATLETSLRNIGFSADDITDVFLTHLHFDHCGGAIQWNKGKTGYEPAFKNATYWSNTSHWEWATNPNPREKASFLKENILPIEESGQLKFVTDKTDLPFDILTVDGHTEKQMIPHIEYQGKKLIFGADLLPTIGHIPLPYVMGYDTRPLLTMKEKEVFLNKAVEDDYFIFLEHDAENEICTLKQTEKGVRLDKTYTFNEIFN
ncbi:MAG: MBL fold metallo-hydrolase [Flavobacteriaceae bacterium]|nr:MBL fold metallo-hydrolase [Flavobacteriaceae bacterium]